MLCTKCKNANLAQYHFTAPHPKSLFVLDQELSTTKKTKRKQKTDEDRMRDFKKSK